VQNQKSHDLPKSSNLPMRLGEWYREIEYRGGRVTQWWHGSSGNARLFYRREFLVFLIFCCKHLQLPSTCKVRVLHKS